MKQTAIYGVEDIDPKAFDQFYKAMELDCVVRGALMADAHLGYALPIGGVVATKDVIFPSWVGYDIGCGMCAVKTDFSLKELDLDGEAIHASIHDHVPVGFRHNRRPVTWREFATQPRTDMLEKMFFSKGGLKQLGTLGGGNHFIEIGYDEEASVWIIVHSGSRNVGHSVATHYMKEASFLHTGVRKAREGHFGFMAVSNDDNLFNDYIKDLKFCEAFALENRKIIIDRVLDALHCSGHPGDIEGEIINRNHNHVEFRDGLIIHRKGATHADKGMLGVIPGNMRDGSFIVRGRGNADALWSSSHGAGRVLGRKQAKETLDFADFQEAMTGLTASVVEANIDESPMAYKDIYAVMEHQKDLVDIVSHVMPIINVKG